MNRVDRKKNKSRTKIARRETLNKIEINNGLVLNSRILFPMDDPETYEGFYNGEQEHVIDGNWIRLHHVITNVTVAVHNRNRSLMATKMSLVYGRPYVRIKY